MAGDARVSFRDAAPEVRGRAGSGLRGDAGRAVAGQDVADSSAWLSAAHSAMCASGPPANDAPSAVSS
jgi:hypothetical protein